MKKLIAIMIVGVLSMFQSCTKKADLLPMPQNGKSVTATRTVTLTFTNAAAATASWNQYSVNGVVQSASTTVKTWTFSCATGAVVSVKQYQNKIGYATVTFNSGVTVSTNAYDMRTTYFGYDAASTNVHVPAADTVGDSFIVP